MQRRSTRPTIAAYQPARRALLSASALAAALLSLGCAPAALAIGSKIDVAVIDRESGDTLHVYHHRGQQYIAGRPGSRYAVRITNRTGERVMAVMSVDGVNIVTGQTADWSQSGYVLAPWQSYDIAGWRKSNQEVAAFEFTALPDSYAARTGRADNVGVIGVAVFTERVYRPAPQPAPPVAPPSPSGRSESRRSDAGQGASMNAPAQKSAQAPMASAESAARDTAPEPVDRLGTGHGARESSHVSNTRFERSSSRPVELINFQYDRYENLARAGVIPQYGLVQPQPRPFPRSNAGYVPDPPSR